MCWHKWKKYKDIEENNYYRICTKCGVAQRGYYNVYDGIYYTTDKTLCRTNTWIDRETYKLRYCK